MTYTFHPFAKSELNLAVDYYEERRPGLGFDFVTEVYAAIQRILEFPNAWTPLSRRSRRCLTRRFPYGVIYQVRQDGTILIVAVMHLSREPNYWADRLE